jgi:AcrR family transcriptional regulator
MDDLQEVAHAETLERPSQVAERLGISTAMLRRHVASYEAVFGALPTSKRDGRLYHGAVVERLGAALAGYHSGRAPSVEEALRRLAAGEETPSEALEAARAPDTMTLLVEELRRLREATEIQNDLLRTQSERIAALEAESRAGREEMKALQVPQQDDTAQTRRLWWRLWRR